MLWEAVIKSKARSCRAWIKGVPDAIVHVAFLAMGTERRQSARNRFDHEQPEVEGPSWSAWSHINQVTDSHLVVQRRLRELCANDALADKEERGQKMHAAN